MSEIAKTVCEKCEGNINRVITGGTGLIFKGSGFYLTDYKNDTKPKVDITESNNSEKSGSTKEGNSESKSSVVDKKSTVKKEKNNE
jgi:predicted nucleic acid-binding Zn ribbon protein